MYENKNFQEVVLLLQQGGYYSTKVLSQRFGVSQKTIQNYIKQLVANSGLEKEGTKYYFPDTFRNQDIHKKVQMSTALMIALYQQAIPELKDSVKENFKELPKERDVFIFDINFESIDNENIFNQLVDAILHKIALSFSYTNTKKETTLKTVYPLKISNMQGYWYFIGYDLASEKIKSYYIKQIEDISKKEESYLSVDEEKRLLQEASLIDSVWYSPILKTVFLKATDEAKYYLERDKNKNVKIIKKTAIYLLLEMSYYNDIEVLNLVKKWLPFISIYENKELQEKLQTILTPSLKNNVL